MKKLLTILSLCFVAIAALAQEKADILVSYTAHEVSLKDGKSDMPHQFILLANGKESKFYSPRTEYIDSLNSTQEGKAALQQMTQNAYLNGNIKDIPRQDGSYYIIKNSDGTAVYELVSTDRYRYNEPKAELNWVIADSTKNILGYECIAATTDFHGRKWTAWFAPEIPIPNGPWKLEGLPGLILEATSDGGQYGFEATGLQHSDVMIGNVYHTDSYETTTREECLKARRAYTDNPLGNIASKYGDGKMTVVDENGNSIDISRIFLPREEIDFIETDY